MVVIAGSTRVVTCYRIRTKDSKMWLYLNTNGAPRTDTYGNGLPYQTESLEDAVRLVKETRINYSLVSAKEPFNSFALDNLELVKFTRTEEVVPWNTGLK